MAFRTHDLRRYPLIEFPRPDACAFPGCRNPRYRGNRYCAGHIAQRYRGQPLHTLRPWRRIVLPASILEQWTDRTRCAIPDCGRPLYRTTPLCRSHAGQWSACEPFRPIRGLRRPRESGPRCTVPGCPRPARHQKRTCRRCERRILAGKLRVVPPPPNASAA